MNTLKISLITLIALVLVSCGGSSYRMVTQIGSDGSTNREVYSFGDSVYMGGDISNNPFLFDIRSGWEVTRFDSVIKHNFFGTELQFNTKVSRNASSIDQYSKDVRFSEDKKSFAAPDESLIKQFRWFYTHYTFKGVYRKLEGYIPISIDNYLTKEEQKLWTQGDKMAMQGLNGSEINEVLSGIESKFMKYYSRNCFEISLDQIKKVAEGYGNLDADKEKIFNQIWKKNKETEINPEIVCLSLDEYYSTDYFSKLNIANKELLEKNFESAISRINIDTVIDYELIIPGKLLTTNAAAVNSDTLIWKVDGMRILADDYLLTAEYRTVNSWAFVLTGLFALVAIGSIVLLLRKKRF